MYKQVWQILTNTRRVKIAKKLLEIRLFLLSGETGLAKYVDNCAKLIRTLS